jgi:hypothetical protein
MRKRQDIDAALKAFADRTKQLKERRIRLLGELVIATGADALSDTELAGALIEIAATTDSAKRVAWARQGEMRFRRHARAGARSGNDAASSPANDDSPQSASGDESAA